MGKYCVSVVGLGPRHFYSFWTTQMVETNNGSLDESSLIFGAQKVRSKNRSSEGL